MTRRDRGSGRVYFDASKNRWVAAITIEGKVTKRLVKTEALAKAKVRELVADHEAGRLASTRITLTDYIADWLAFTILPSKAARTYEAYKGKMEKHVLPTLGHRRLTSLEAKDFRALYAALVAMKDDDREPLLSPNSVRVIHAILHSALRQAVKDELVYRNVLDAVEAPRHVEFEATPLSAEQAQALIAAMKGHVHEHLWQFILWTGCRFGEAAGLRWPYVDEEHFNARIWWAASPVPTALRPDPLVWWEFKELKNRQRRSVPLTLPALAALRAQRDEIARLRDPGGAWQDLALVFPGDDGRPLRETAVQKRWRSLLRSCKLPATCRIHDLRHTTAEISLDNGAELIDVARLLGHRDVTITDRIYAGRLAKSTRRAAERVADALGDQRPDALSEEA